MGKDLVRQWLILSMVPKVPPRIDVAGVERGLLARGVRVTRRTIQRDLVELARIFPLVSDARAKPFGWRWAEDAERFCSLPILSDPPTDEAIAIHLRVAAPIARAVVEALRGRDGNARDVRTSAGDGDGVRVQARVGDSVALRRFLFGFGDGIEVLEPVALREDFARRAARIAAAYRDATMTE